MAHSKPSRKKKTKIWTQAQFLERALEKQHQVVGAPYTRGQVLEEGWYQKRSWTPEQYRSFATWFIKTAQERLLFNEKFAQHQFAWWDLNYGWKDSPLQAVVPPGVLREGTK